MIHDQYLKGDLSLTITDADLSKRTWYTCQCGSRDVCDVRLQTETLNTTLQVQPHEPLFLKLDVSDPVKVIYSHTGGAAPSSGQICTVDGGSLQCRPDYTPRVSVFSALELRGVTPSDGGVYSIVDVRNGDVVHSYTVSVQGDQSENRGDPDDRAAVPVWVKVVLRGAAVCRWCCTNRMTHGGHHCCWRSVVVVLGQSGSESATHTVREELHESATLPCSERCSGLVRWTVSHKLSEVLAECNQTVCRSVKEGYQMIHDQYLKGDLSLTITDADLSKRTWYTCQCDSKDVCDVRLQTETLNTTLQVQPHEPLFLKLDVSDPVKVIYSSTGAAGPSSVQICTVDGGSLQCIPDYTQRVSVFSALELRGVTPSDGGVYTIVDVRNGDVVHSYTVSVQGDQPENRGDPDNGAAIPVWVMVLGVMWTGLAVVMVVLGVMMVWLWRKNLRLQMGGRKNRADTNHHHDYRRDCLVTRKIRIWKGCCTTVSSQQD
ncbi:hypothetical protein NFI96_027036 [Prochilodus magdalenae]|nr:hypothetical protein NFI96_027036 [Prochilodus magdalenae]